MPKTIPPISTEDTAPANQLSDEPEVTMPSTKKYQGEKFSLNPERITSPIPLIAYTGTLYIALTGGYLVLIDNKTIGLHWAVYAFPVIFPLLLLISIVYLIINHHEKLYSPKDFSSAEYFLLTLKSKSQEFINMTFIDDLNITDSKRFDANEIKDNKYKIVFDKASANLSAFEAVITGLSVRHLEILHSWYNAAERHDLALICMDLAIARGAANSKNFSYRAASLRKLDRLIEASGQNLTLGARA